MFENYEKSADHLSCSQLSWTSLNTAVILVLSCTTAVQWQHRDSQNAANFYQQINQNLSEDYSDLPSWQSPTVLPSGGCDPWLVRIPACASPTLEPSLQFAGETLKNDHNAQQTQASEGSNANLANLHQVRIQFLILVLLKGQFLRHFHIFTINLDVIQRNGHQRKITKSNFEGGGEREGFYLSESLP